ncbi:MAG TPA: alpha/beta fold hydrolase [Hymenobacter sp.]|jgi:pimeloyl-ACP methyl ester carboxylesterase|uniref:alpha/beta fold hydrolase n=1 Tax=Hymenobacter sp. TaxID=1898978 RepID=UPI002EDAFCEA
MYNLLNAWKALWHPSQWAHSGMPTTEKDPGDRVPYPYSVHKIQLSEALEIAYVDEGDRAADVLLLVHGMGSGIPSWHKNIDAFKKHFRCLALDLPGHGYSTKADFPYTIRFYADTVLAFLDRLGIERATLVGHSMGGQTAIVAALKAPQRVERLVLVSPAGIEPYTSLEKQLLINMASGIVGSGNAFTHNQMNVMIGFCNRQQEAGDLLKRLAFFKNDAAVFGKTMLRSVEGMLLESVNHVLTEVRQPALLVVGADDKVSPYQYLRGQEYAELVAREAVKLPRGKLVVVPRCGHFVQYQRPEAFNKGVLEFLKQKELA